MHKSAQVALAPLRLADSPLLWRWINDRDLVLFNSPYKPVSESQHQEWFEGVQRRRDAVIFGIRVLETDELIGSAQLYDIDYVKRSAAWQTRLGNVEIRGKGYGTEAGRLLMDFAFKDLNLHRVYCHVYSTNIASVRMNEKIGFRQEGWLRKADHINGEYVDLIMFGLLREDYEAQ